MIGHNLSVVEDSPAGPDARIAKLNGPFDIATATSAQMKAEIHRFRALVAAGGKRITLVQDELHRVQAKSLTRRDMNVWLREKNVELGRVNASLTESLVLRDEVITRMEQVGTILRRAAR